MFELPSNLDFKLKFSVMINRGKWRDCYWRGRGEILWSFQELLLRRHFTKMLSLIKDEGYGREDD